MLKTKFLFETDDKMITVKAEATDVDSYGLIEPHITLTENDERVFVENDVFNEIKEETFDRLYAQKYEKELEF